MKQRHCRCGCITNQEIIEEEQEVQVASESFNVNLLKAICPECGKKLRNERLEEKNKLRINQAYRSNF